MKESVVRTLFGIGCGMAYLAIHKFSEHASREWIPNAIASAFFAIAAALVDSSAHPKQGKEGGEG